MTTQNTTPDTADFNLWMQAIVLKIESLRADIEYIDRTSFCSDCPGIAGDCCKGSDSWQDQFNDDFDYINALWAAHESLKALSKFKV